MKKLRSSPIIYFISLLTVVLAASAEAVPVRARTTLLSLYTQSDTILIGRLDKREEFGVNRVGEGFLIVNIRTSFDVSSVLKGEPRKFVTVEDEEFRYQVRSANGSIRDASFAVGRDGENVEQPNPGDAVLVFLKREGDALVLADPYHGVRKVAPREQRIYIERIQELDSIFASERLEPSRVAEWLIRCVRDPATRWDGAHELLQGIRAGQWTKNTDPNGYERIDPTVSTRLGIASVAILDDNMKAVLSQVLIDSAGIDARSDGDDELIKLVKLWDPNSAVVMLLAQLKSKAYSSHETAGIMYKISKLLGDQRTPAIFESYSDLRRTGIVTSNKTLEDKLSVVLDRFIACAETELSNR